jgi:coenzyme Q-binding protein COQ10
MTYVRITRRVSHRWADLFLLVLDVESYPTFLPHCCRVELLSRRGEATKETVIISRMTVGLSALQLSYANRTDADFARRTIRVEACDGPFQDLTVVWRFHPEGDDCTRVDFSANFELSGMGLAAVASRILSPMFRDIVTAFERRADLVFGHA